MNQSNQKSVATARFVFGDVGHCLACGLGTGLVPRIAGTIGTLPAFGLYYLTDVVLGLSLLAQWLLLLLLFCVGVWLCERTGQALQHHDDRAIVLDEIVAFYGVLLCVPSQWVAWLVAFVIFRILDATKPPPIGWIDKNVGGGLGVMLDDVVAAVLSVILLIAISLLLNIVLVFD